VGPLPSVWIGEISVGGKYFSEGSEEKILEEILDNHFHIVVRVTLGRVGLGGVDHGGC
jgi:hypothetical protein